MIKTKAQSGKFKAFVLVRDLEGNPKFDDWNNIPEEMLGALSESDLEYIENKQRQEISYQEK